MTIDRPLSDRPEDGSESVSKVPPQSWIVTIARLRGLCGLWLIAILATGTIGFAAVGTLFAAMLIRARSRDVLLPVLLYPVTVPVIIAGVRGTAALLQPELDGGIVRFWFALLVCFDVVFVTLALWTFEPVMTD